MKNCPNCGSAKKGSEKFCLNCGHRFEIEAAASVPHKTKRSPLTPKQVKTRLAGLVVVAIIIVGIVGAHLFLQAKYDASKSIVGMNQAFSKSEPDKFFSYFTIAEDVEADEEAFYSFVESEDWEYLRDQLKKETELLEKEGMSNIIPDSNGNKFISVVSEPIFLGLYNHVSFLVHPISVEVEMPMDKTNLIIGAKKVTGNKGETVAAGKFLPGNYEWEASAASEYSEIKNSGAVELRGNGSNGYILSPELTGGTLKITSDVAGAILFIEGKSTKKTIKEMDSIGPLPFDGSVEIMAETKDDKGKTVKSDPIAIESETAHITFDHVQEKAAAERAKKQKTEALEELVEAHGINATDFITSFRDEFETALNYGDFSYISSFFLPGSQVQADYAKDIERHNDMENYYSYDFESTVITGIKALDEDTLQLTTEEKFFFSSDEDDYNYKKTKQYTLQIDDYGYYITKIDQLTSDQEAI